MIEKTCNVFFKDEVDNRTKVVCIFNSNVSDEEMIKVISKYLEENEMDEEDNEYATIVSKEDCDNEAYKIVKGEMLDLDLDKYWLEKNMPMYINNFTF
jgi:hypothetical protein